MAKTTRNTESHSLDLIKYRILNLADLEINKSSHLSNRQKYMLYANMAYWLTIALFDLIILMFIIYFIIGLQRSFVIGLLGGVYISSLAFTCITYAKPYWKDIQDDRPNAVSGKIYKQSGTQGGGIMEKGSLQIGYCTIRIENQTFSISPLIYDQIIQEENYRIYFVSNSRKLINIEPI